MGAGRKTAFQERTGERDRDQKGNPREIKLQPPSAARGASASVTSPQIRELGLTASATEIFDQTAPERISDPTFSARRERLRG